MGRLYKYMQDITLIHYTADKLPWKFKMEMRKNLNKIIQDNNYRNIFINQDSSQEPSHLQIYRNALFGARQADTKYVAFCEDDVLYTPDHFEYRPHPGVFAYNKNYWSIYTWVKPAIFSYKDRRNMFSLICERELFIEAMEERFKKYPDETNLNIGNWAEPGKYEDNLGITKRQSEIFFSKEPLVAFSHETALSFKNLGTRKKLGQPRAFEIPYWGRAEDIIKLYD